MTHSGADKRPLPSIAPPKQAATLELKRSLQALVGILTTRFAVALLQAAEVTFAVLTIVSYVILPFTYMANHCRNS